MTTVETTQSYENDSEVQVGESSLLSKKQFRDNANEMGLTQGENPNCFYYSDRFSAVAYKYLYTAESEEIPAISVHTGPDLDNLEFRGVLSDVYRFKGNEDLVNSIEESIQESNTPVFNRRARLTPNYCKFNYSVVIENRNNFPSVGDVRPMMDIQNSYNGTRAGTVVFGIQIRDSNGVYECGLGKKFGKFREVHLQTARTRLSPIIGSFTETFSQGIDQLVRVNNEGMDNDTITDTLRLIEKLGGKKRRANVAAALDEINSERERITSWDIFKAITHYTTNEENLNIKRLEDLVERVLYVPTGMYRMVRQNNS